MVTIDFSISFKADYGDSVYVVGNLPQLGSWSPSKGLKLKWQLGHLWTGRIKILSDTPEAIEYKYVVAASNITNSSKNPPHWEDGTNRILDLSQKKKEYIKLKDIWETRRIRFYLPVVGYSILSPPAQIQPDLHQDTTGRSCSHTKYYISFNIQDIEGSYSLFPRKMELVYKKIPLQGALQRNRSLFWRYELCLPSRVTSFKYQYLAKPRYLPSGANNQPEYIQRGPQRTFQITACNPPSSSGDLESQKIIKINQQHNVKVFDYEFPAYIPTQNIKDALLRMSPKEVITTNAVNSKKSTFNYMTMAKETLLSDDESNCTVYLCQKFGVLVIDVRVLGETCGFLDGKGVIFHRLLADLVDKYKIVKLQSRIRQPKYPDSSNVFTQMKSRQNSSRRLLEERRDHQLRV